ncbi:hypothetical protein LINPERHAP1_LOCUS13133 [Linum perenne]
MIPMKDHFEKGEQEGSHRPHGMTIPISLVSARGVVMVGEASRLSLTHVMCVCILEMVEMCVWNCVG